MEKVLGFGGFFFRSRNPGELAKWYRDNLGINLVPQSAEDGQPWRMTEGVCVFAPFAADTEYFRADKSFQINFRVADLDAMVAQLKAAGIEVVPQDDMPGIGRFAHLEDPEGTPIELWEPAPGAG